jgi:hypothetical protein
MYLFARQSKNVTKRKFKFHFQAYHTLLPRRLAATLSQRQFERCDG